MAWPKGLKHTPEMIAKKRKAQFGTKRSPEVCANIREGIRRRRDTPEYRAKLSAALLGNQNSRGRATSPETRKRLSEATSRSYLENPALKEVLRGNQHALGYKHTAETRHKIGANTRAQGHEYREKMRQSTSHLWNNPSYRVHVFAGWKRASKRKGMTSIERILSREFKKRRLKFEMHKTMFKRYQPDFVFEQVKLIVEADGDYWHRQLKRDHVPLFQAAAKNGWTVWRFAESEITQHPEACGRAVARFVRSH
jgi:very-short-patch-repair endonuclease